MATSVMPLTWYYYGARLAGCEPRKLSNQSRSPLASGCCSGVPDDRAGVELSFEDAYAAAAL